MNRNRPKKLGNFKGKKVFNGQRAETLTFLRKAVGVNMFKDDYKELLELSIFVMDDSYFDISFKKPGCISNARFMAKALYAIKAFIFQEEMGLTSEEIDKRKKLTIFISHIYTQY